MKKLLFSLGLLATLFFVADVSPALGQVTNNYWLLSSGTLKPIISTYTLTLPYLAGSGAGCASVSNAGLIGFTSCGSGGGSGVATSSLFATYPLKVVSNSSSITYSLLDMATTTLSGTGGISVSNSPFVIGGSAAVISCATCTLNGVTSVTGTYPIISSGGTTPAISTAFGTTTANTFSLLQTFTNGYIDNASSTHTAFTNFQNASTTQLTAPVIWTGLGTAAGTFLAADPSGKIIATSSPAGAVTSVSNGDGTLTISPTTGAVVASLALGHANIWTAQQTFNTSPTIGVNTNGLLLGGNVWAYASSTNQNTIFGINAGGNNATTSTGINTAIGYSALANAVNSAVTGNTALGANALLTNQGTNNVAAGDSAGSKYTGSKSVLFGSGVGNTNTISGDGNIFIGYQDCGNCSGGAGGNILLGTSLNLPTLSGNAQLNIGNILYGNNLYNVPGTLSSQPVANGNIGIGTSTPWGKFALSLNSGDTNANAFIIASSSSSGTTALFSISNTGVLTQGGGASSTFSNGINLSTGCITYNGGACLSGGSGTVTSIATNNGITGGTITTTGTIGLAAIAANSVLGNITGASAVPVAVATSSLFNIASNGVGGILSSTEWAYIHTATTTFSGPLSYSPATNAVTCPTCNTSSATVTSVATTYPVTGGTFTTSGTIALAFGTTTANTWSSLQTVTNGFISNASSTVASGLFRMSGGASTTNATASGTMYANNFYDTSAAGSSCIGDSGGILENGNCVASLASAGGSLTISSPTGNVDASINTAHSNSFSVLQSFANATSTLFTCTTCWATTGLTIPSATSPTVTASGAIAINTTAASTSVQFGSSGTQYGLFNETPWIMAFATTTTAAGTTTVGFSAAGRDWTATQVTCTSQDSGTWDVQFGNGTASTTMVVSDTSGTTQTFTTLSSNNTFTYRQKWYIAYGTPSATSNRGFSCTLMHRYTN